MEQGPLGGNLRPQQPANNRQIRTNVALPAQEVRGVNFRRLFFLYYFPCFQKFSYSKGVQVIIGPKLKVRIMSSVTMLKHNVIYKRFLVIYIKSCRKRLKLSAQIKKKMEIIVLCKT